MKFSTLSMLGLAVATTGLLAYSDAATAAGGAKTTFERNKPHVNVGTSRSGGQVQPGGIGTGSPINRSHPELVFKQPYPVGPLPGAPMSGYCGPNQGGGVAKTVVVPVRNNGNKSVDHFMVKVSFAGHTHSKAYGPLSPGATDTDSFVIPNGAWNSGTASFSIEIDSTHKVNEGLSGEKNNVVNSYCVAPAG